MGCWNKTCAISNLHISAGQRVAIFILGRNNHRNDSYCYPNAYYDACLLPFYGEYNDYGSAENCSGIGMNYVIEAIKNKLVEMKQGENIYHESPADKNTFDIEQLFELDHQGRLSVEGNSWPIGEAVFLTHIQIHGDIFDAIINDFKLEDYREVNGEFKRFEYGFSDVVADLPEYIRKLRTTMEEMSELSNESLKLRWALSGIRMGLFDHNDPNLAGKWLRFSEGGESSRQFLIRGSELIVAEAVKMNDEELTALLIEFLKGEWINAFMFSTRRAWIKPTGEGSQRDEHTGYEVLMDAMKKVLDGEKAERAEWEAEYGDMDEPSEEEADEANEYFMPKGDSK